ncbi:MAG TPA: single-stranded DNA-binding protein [Anaerolineaceae bacterium]|nr:single-stranded DNA-binding protein [Anaerolineaceae bacterium]
MFHTIIIVGNVGKEPEMRYTPNGQAVTSFSLASSRNYTGQNGQLVKETIWFRVSVWAKQAETVSQYVHKGSKVLVEGRLIADPATGGPRVWTRQDGTPGASFEVTASTVRFLSSKAEGTAAAGEEPGEVAGDVGAEGDIPF